MMENFTKTESEKRIFTASHMHPIKVVTFITEPEPVSLINFLTNKYQCLELT